MTIWWRARPSWLRWSVWAAVMAAVVTVSNFANALGSLNPWLPATRGYVTDAVNPVLIVSLQNTVQIIEARKAAIRSRIDMAAIRLSLTPNDQVVRDALAAAKHELDMADWDESQAQCAIRAAVGLGCGD